ncbi:MAG: hypothetical protein GYA17_20500 [Chloroflexi bacterium]|nr:hypothetical protein [Anaerolineaceae bacterium]NMB90747.1 hypothetical protein [Chloroflexota bacterium]
MMKLKLSLIATLAYLALVFTFARINLNQIQTVEIHSFLYGVILLAIISVLAIRRLQTWPVYVAMTLWAGIYILFRLFLYNSVPLFTGIYLYLTVTELVMLLIAVALGYSVAGSLNEFEQFIEKVTLPDVGQRVVRLDQATEMIKTEFIRSRRHSRPLALLLVEPTSLSFEPELERAVRDIQEKMTERFVAANLAQVIANEARRTDVILSKDGTGRFVVLCPETNGRGTVNLAERIQDDLVDKLGVSVAYGIASFPDEALTFEDLLKRAEFNLQNYVQIPEEKRTITNDSH